MLYAVVYMYNNTCIAPNSSLVLRCSLLKGLGTRLASPTLTRISPILFLITAQHAPNAAVSVRK